VKAIVYETYGPPEVLQLKEVDKPTPGDDEVLIRVRVAEVTKADCEMRRCRSQVTWLWLPMRLTLGLMRPKRPILGMYLAGEVEAVGRDVTRFRPGDRVFGSSRLRLGAHSEYVCVPAAYTLVPIPATVSFVEAAAVPLGGLNALHFLKRADIRTGEKALVNGAGGKQCLTQATPCTARRRRLPLIARMI
jgi:NADPH:quinone reductase-like Zn-dependent oxidoreductase